jgi:hypothetical protein
MKTSFLSHALVLRDLFDRRLRFDIPLYQRPYAWTTNEAARLLEDLIDAMGEDKQHVNFPTYFLGAIILTGESRRENGRPAPLPDDRPVTEQFQRLLAANYDPAVKDCCKFEIVDGKQRLITLLILLSLLRDLAPAAARGAFANLVGNDSPDNPYRLHLSGGEHDFFVNSVLAPGATQLEVDLEGMPNSQKNIKQVRDDLREMLLELNEEDRQRLLDYILDHCEIVVILSNAFDNAFQIFLSINDTGTRLVQGDILKVDLMTSIDRPLRQQYINIWESWNDSLGEPETKHGVKKTFFNHFWYALAANPSNMLTDIRAQVNKSGGAVPFIDDYLVPHAGAYRIIKSREWPHAENKQEMEHILGVLDWLTHDEWMSAAMLAITSFERQLLAAPDRAAHDWIVEFFRRLECFSYCLMIQGNSAYNRRKRYNPVKRGLREPGGDRDPLQELLLKDGEKSAIRKLIAHGLHRNRSQAAKLVLLRLEQQLSGRPVAYYNELMERVNLSVEHLLPRNPRDRSRWLSDYPNEKDRGHAAELLGNLFLVLEPENQEMKNFDFPIKHEVMFRDKGAHPVAMAEQLRNQRSWLRSDIDARQQQLAALADKLWKLTE